MRIHDLFWSYIFFGAMCFIITKIIFYKYFVIKHFVFTSKSQVSKLKSPHSSQVDILVIFTNSINASPNLSARAQSSVSASGPQIRRPFWFLLAPAQKAEDQWYQRNNNPLGRVSVTFHQNPLLSNVNTRVIVLLHQAGFDPLR